MKTKAYKLKENIARYMYKYIGSEDVSICFDNDIYSCQKFEIHLYGKTWEQHNSLFIKSKRDELERILGFPICISDGKYGKTLLWNKKKEEMCQKFENTIYVVGTDTDYLGCFRNRYEAEDLQFHLTIALNKKVDLEKKTFIDK